MHSFLSYSEREERLLAPYALRSKQSRGREHDEADHPYRSPFQRDRDRIIHSSAFRRLADKTQVFMNISDYHRTRLTHTIEVVTIARTIGRSLGLNEELIEALGYLHDLGHPPFGHTGEDVLKECMVDCGGFSHNAFGLVLVKNLEIRSPYYDGLNLTHEVLEGQITRVDKRQMTFLRPLLEAQTVETCDSITYDAHDADDALKLGLVKFEELICPKCRAGLSTLRRVNRATAPEDGHSSADRCSGDRCHGNRHGADRQMEADDPRRSGDV